MQSDLDKSRKQIFFEKTEKEKFIKRSDKATQRLHEQYAGELRDKYDRIRLKNRILIFGVFPLITIVITGVIIYFKSDSQSSIWVEQFTGLGINIIAWLMTDFLFFNKKIRSKYSERINGINEEVEKKNSRNSRRITSHNTPQKIIYSKATPFFCGGNVRRHAKRPQIGKQTVDNLVTISNY